MTETKTLLETIDALMEQVNEHKDAVQAATARRRAVEHNYNEASAALTQSLAALHAEIMKMGGPGRD